MADVVHVLGVSLHGGEEHVAFRLGAIDVIYADCVAGFDFSFLHHFIFKFLLFYLLKFIGFCRFRLGQFVRRHEGVCRAGGERESLLPANIVDSKRVPDFLVAFRFNGNVARVVEVWFNPRMLVSDGGPQNVIIFIRLVYFVIERTFPATSRLHGLQVHSIAFGREGVIERV